MKRLFISVFIIALTAAITGCSNDNNNDIINPEPTNPSGSSDLTANITSDMTLTADKVWTLDGRISVTSGNMLTIEPGTIIKAKSGSGANASALIIAQGAKIMANGTADKPIIFTSETDKIAGGETELNENDRGLWGGLLILGKAPASFDGDSETGQVEGIPASDINGRFGGSDPADNSGILNYVSVRHGGTVLGTGNEINGITMGAVGSGTKVSNIEVIANLDDGIEFFGGTVDVSNVFIWAVEDDGLDIDESYSGTISNSVVLQGAEADSAMEIDGPEGSLQGAFTAKNITLIGSLDAKGNHIIDFRDGAQGSLDMFLIKGFKTTSDVQIKSNSVAANFVAGKLTFLDWAVDGTENPSSLFAENVADGESKLIDPLFSVQAEAWVTTGKNGGADMSVFTWTQASANGAL